MTPKDVTHIVQELVTHMGLQLSPEVTQDGDIFLINLAGADVRYLENTRDNRVGAFITVIKLIIKKRFDADPKIVLDFNNQRKQRLENVAQMARKTAEMVRVRGGEEELRPMSPAERRAVHMALKEMKGITTESRGTEPHRRIVISQAQDQEVE